MPKTNFPNRIKIAVLNIMQAFGSAASQMARNAKLRVQEINLESRRHEILTEFSLQAFEMWHNGVKLPKELSAMFTELNEIDNKLSVLRAQKFVKVEGEEAVAEDEEAALPAEEAEQITETEAADQPAPTEKPAAPEEPKPAEAPAAEAPAEPATEKPAPKKARPAVKRKARTAKTKPKE